MDKIKVLMIDDNVNLIEMVKEYFKDKNIEIAYEAYNGEEGIIELEKHKDELML